MSSTLKGALEDNILTALVYSDAHAAQIAIEVTPELFSNRQYQRIAEVALEHLNKFRVPPKEHIRDLLERETTRGEYVDFYKRILSEMAQLAKSLQLEYVLEQLGAFVETRKLTAIVNEASDLLHEGKLDEALETIRKTNYKAKGDEGSWLHDTQSWFGFLDRNEEPLISCGISVLDERGVSLARKEMFLFLAPTGRGKSWFLIEVGRRALIEGRLNVCHISLENSLDITRQRYTQAFLAITKDEEKHLRVPLIRVDDLGRMASVDFDTVMAEGIKTLGRKKLEQRLKPIQRKGRLYAHWFPEGMLTLAMLDNFLDSLERLHAFVPDVLILDYPDKMALDPKNLRASTGQLYSGLRGLAGRRNLALATASQTNRVSSEVDLVRANHVAEDWSKIGIADVAVTFSQTEEEAEMNLARILVAKARNAPDGWIALITQSYATGQFCLDSVYFDKVAQSEMKRLIGEEE